MSSKHLNIDFIPFITKLKNLKLTDLRKLDALLSDISGQVFEAIDIISDELPGLNTADHKAALVELKTIQEQVNNLGDLLYDISSDYDSHSMDRLLNILGSLEEDIADALEDQHG